MLPLKGLVSIPTLPEIGMHPGPDARSDAASEDLAVSEVSLRTISQSKPARELMVGNAIIHHDRQYQVLKLVVHSTLIEIIATELSRPQVRLVLLLPLDRMVEWSTIATSYYVVDRFDHAIPMDRLRQIDVHQLHCCNPQQLKVEVHECFGCTIIGRIYYL
jgi:hypothetical protein